MAIGYASSRHTIDVDFSTSSLLREVDINFVKEELDKKLITVSENLTYGMACRIQKFNPKPKDPEATWPTFRITVGYAYKDDTNNFRRLQKGYCSSVLKIDYSFNEIIMKTEPLKLTHGEEIQIYSYMDLISEKYRAILQQVQRQRNRSQDIYDIYYILKNFDIPDEETKLNILKAMIKKSESRHLQIDKYSMSDQEIRKRSEKKYQALDQTISEKLPPFQEAFEYIENFYENLPWTTKK